VLAVLDGLPAAPDDLAVGPESRLYAVSGGRLWRADLRDGGAFEAARDLPGGVIRLAANGEQLAAATQTCGVWLLAADRVVGYRAADSAILDVAWVGDRLAVLDAGGLTLLEPAPAVPDMAEAIALQEPADGAAIDGESVTLRWDAGAADCWPVAATVTIILAEGDARTLTADAQTLTVADLPPAQWITWRVTAVDLNGQQRVSADRRFYTGRCLRRLPRRSRMRRDG
jgi:hypothetical protein